MNNYAIEVRELSHHYKAILAVDKISFQVKRGSIFGLLGPNGAGKSTTVKMLTTLLPLSSGSAQIVGYDVVKDSTKVRENIGYVPQSLSADGDLTAYENLLLSSKLYGLDRKKREEKISQLLEFMGLTQFSNNLVKTYSGGMIRRLEIAQALVQDPKVLFLDEPTAGLDPAARRSLWHHLLAWKKEFETTILLTTHDMNEADTVSDIVAFMHLGHIVAMDSPSELKNQLGKDATLDDVFIKQTGLSIKEEDTFDLTKELKEKISHEE